MLVAIPHPTDLKVCTRCSTPRYRSQFHRNKRKADGLDIYCKKCNTSRVRAKYAGDAEWRALKIQQTRQYHLEHPEWSKERLRAHHVANAEVRYQRERKRLQDPERKDKSRAATRRSESRRRAIKASVTADVISADEFATILSEYKNSCWMCEREFVPGVVLHWDHYRPLSKGGDHVVNNMRPACSECNIRKNGRWPISDADVLNIKLSTLRAVHGRKEVL